jgi:hypothetical protein
VLDYLLERYRDDAAALLPAPPPLESVYLNQRAIVVNQHRSLGLVAGVKSAHEAANRINLVLARMYDPARIAEDSAVDLERPAVAEDPWFDWIEPSDRTIREFWFNRMGISRRRLLRRSRIVESAMQRMPFLPKATVHELYLNIVRGKGHAVWAAELLSICRNRVALGYIVHAWRHSIAAQQEDGLATRLRQALVNWHRRAADPIRSLLSDENGEVRAAAATLLAEIGELRDIGIFADLLAMPTLPDEEPAERMVLAEAMEKLAKRLHQPQSALA